MRTAKLIVGIISIVSFVVICIQSCATEFYNISENINGDMSSLAGFFLGLCVLIAGIIGITTKNSKGGAITAGAFYVFGGVIGFINLGTYTDLVIWSVISIGFAALLFISAAIPKKKINGLPEQMGAKFCGKCGAMIGPDQKFCGNCGEKW